VKNEFFGVDGKRFYADVLASTKRKIKRFKKKINYMNKFYVNAVEMKNGGWKVLDLKEFTKGLDDE
jgi:hypothetical protein